MLREAKQFFVGLKLELDSIYREGLERFHLLRRGGFWLNLITAAVIVVVMALLAPKQYAGEPFARLCFISTIVSLLGFGLAYTCSCFSCWSLVLGTNLNNLLNPLPKAYQVALLTPLGWTTIMFGLGVYFLFQDNILAFLLVYLGYGILFLIWDIVLLAASRRLERGMGHYKSLAFDYIFRADLPAVASTVFILVALFAMRNRILLDSTGSVNFDTGHIAVMGDHLVPLGATLVQLVLLGFIVLVDTAEAIVEETEEGLE